MELPADLFRRVTKRLGRRPLSEDELTVDERAELAEARAQHPELRVRPIERRMR